MSMEPQSTLSIEALHPHPHGKSDMAIPTSVSTSTLRSLPPLAFLDSHKKAKSLAKLEKPKSKLLSTSSNETVKNEKPLLVRRNSVTVDGSTLPTVRKTLADYYTIHHQLGEGVSSKVFLAQNKKTGEMVAIKIIPKNILINNSQLSKEIKILKTISHKYIIGMKDVFITEEYLQIIMEVAEGYQLFDHICQRRTFTEKDAKGILIKLLDALAYLHDEGIVHRDLKPENIMFVQSEDGTSNLKLIDFGFARDCKEQNILEAPVGTLGYKAPEVLSHQPYSTKTDMWSLGVITYILLVGFPPFFSDPEHWDENTILCYPFWYLFNEETENLLTAIKSGKVEYPDHFWQQINPDAKDFVCKLLKVDPEERLSALEALRHPWLKPVTQGFVETASNTLANSPSDSTLPEIECPDKDETDDTTDEEDSDEEAAISPKSDTNEALPSQTNLSAFCKRLLKSTPAKQKVKDHNLEHPLISEKFLDAEFVPTGTALDTLSSVYAKTDEAPETEVTEEKPITEQVNTETPELGDSKKQTKQLPRKLYRHQWRKITGTFCSECENFIYGLSDKHGYKCKNCKLVVHRDCRQNAPVNCLRSKRRRQAVERANEDSFNGGHSPRKQLKSKTAKGKDPEVSPKERKSRRESKVRTSPSKYAEKESTEPRTSRPVRSRGDTLDLLDVKGSKYNYRDSPFLPSFTREYDVAPKTKSQKFRRASNGASKEEMGKFHSPRQRKSSFGSKESLDRILNSARRMARSKEDPSPNEVKRKPSVGNFPSPRRTSHSKTTNDASTQEHGQPQRKTSDKAKQHTSFSPRSSKKASRTTEKADVPSPVAMTFSSPDLPSLNLKEEGNKTPHNLRGNGLHHSGNSLHHSGNSLHHSSHHNSHHSSHHSAHHPDHNHLRVMETHPESSSSRRHEGTPHNNKKETLEIVD